MNSSTTLAKRPFRCALAFALLALPLLALYTTALTAFPGYVDEGHHIRWAAEVWQGQVLFPVSTGKPLLIYLLALLFPGPGALWLSRIGIVLCLPLTLAGLVAVGQRMGRPTQGWFAAALFALTPWGFFHGRMAIAEPIIAASAVWLLALSLRPLHAPWFARIGLPAALLIALPLTKFTAISFWAIPLLVLWLHPLKPQSLGDLVWTYLLATLGLAAILGVAALRVNVLGEFEARVGSEPINYAVLLIGNARDLARWVGSYLAPGWLLLTGVGMLLGAGFRQKDTGLWVLIVLVGGLPFMVISAVYSRYYLVLIPFLALLAADPLDRLWHVAAVRRCAQGATLAVLLLATWPMPAFVTAAYRTPAQLPLPSDDVRQYISDWSAGFGVAEATTGTLALLNNQPGWALAGDLSTYTIMYLYWSSAQPATLVELWSETGPDLVLNGLPEIPTYVVLDSTLNQPIFTGLPIDVLLVAQYDRPGGQPVIVYRLQPSSASP